MKIALPLTESDEFSAHYGAAARFEIFEIDRRRRAVGRRTIVAPTESEPCAWAPLLHAAGVTLLLVGGMGSGARHRMAEHAIDVIAGVQPAAPADLVAAWLADRLVRGNNQCDSSGGHRHAGRHQTGDSCHSAP